MKVGTRQFSQFALEKPITGHFGEKNLDKIGRIVMPTVVRRAFEGHDPYLIPGIDGCIWVIPELDYVRVMGGLCDHFAARWTGDRNALTRSLNAFVEKGGWDDQGRMTIPDRLKEYAGITDSVVVIGNFDIVELWSPQRCPIQERPSADALNSQLKEIFGQAEKLPWESESAPSK